VPKLNAQAAISNVVDKGSKDGGPGGSFKVKVEGSANLWGECRGAASAAEQVCRQAVASPVCHTAGSPHACIPYGGCTVPPQGTV